MYYKLSQWHNGIVKPVHKGIYQCDSEGFYRLWNGNLWLIGSWDMEDAMNSTEISNEQTWRWRGIVK